jgi:glucose/arabinose dehydrogenase
MNKKAVIGIWTCAMGFAICGSRAEAQVIDAELIASGFNRPVDIQHAPGDPDRLFIVQQPGQIRILDLNTNTVLATPFLDIDFTVNNGYGGNGEQGLFSLAFHPNYSIPGDPNEGNFFVHYSNNAGTTVIQRYTVSANPNVADTATALTIFTSSQPFPNHNGGSIVFGPDGYLYVGLGDGGSGNDPGNRAQNLLVILGKILRIDVNHSAPGDPYAIPADNPFVGQAALEEIWAYGIRNPWRLSFDRLMGDLYIADVGQNQREEISFQPACSAGGENYGWRCMEANRCTGLSGCTCFSDDLVDPIHEFLHNAAGGFSVTGGYVYRGCEIPELFGHYLFADFISELIWSVKVENGVATQFTVRSGDLNPPTGDGKIDDISSFGEDARGEIYVAERGSTNGRIFKIVRQSTAPIDDTPPQVMHMSAANYGGYVDPRMESTNGVDVNLGLSEVVIEFDKPVIGEGCLALTPASFEASVTGGGDVDVVGVSREACDNINQVRVTLSDIIPIQEWTTVVAGVQDFNGNAIASEGNLGDADEPDRVDIAFLPCDVSGDGRVQPIDLLRLRQVLSGVITDPDQGTLQDMADIDRNGTIQALDLLRFRQLFNGSGNATRVWSEAPNDMLLSDRP